MQQTGSSAISTCSVGSEETLKRHPVFPQCNTVWQPVPLRPMYVCILYGYMGGIESYNIQIYVSEKLS